MLTSVPVRRIAADSGFTGSDAENAESAQLQCARRRQEPAFRPSKTVSTAASALVRAVRALDYMMDDVLLINGVTSLARLD